MCECVSEHCFQCPCCQDPIMGADPNGFFFGTGKDGVLTTSGSMSFTSQTDGPMIVKQYKSVTINSGHVVTVTKRNKGLLIYSQGDCTINGEVSTVRVCKNVKNICMYASMYASMCHIFTGDSKLKQDSK